MSDTFVPVFCTAKLSPKVIDKYFEEANKATTEACYEVPVGFLMLSTDVPDDIEDAERATVPPIDGKTLDKNPFKGKTHAEIASWTLKNIDLKTGLLKHELVILDERSGQDETCQLIALKEDFDKSPGLDEAPEKWISVRSDFESSLVTIMTVASGAGGYEHFETSLSGGFEGVLRIKDKLAEEREKYPPKE